MNLTTKGRYAVMAMVDIAMQGSKVPVTLSDVSLRQEIAVNYLEQIFMKLRKNGLVTSVRGPGGGYILPVEPCEIKISDIVSAVEESIKMTRCGNRESGGCVHKGAKCITHDLWEGLSERIFEYLNSVSLVDICKGVEQNTLTGKEAVNA